MYMSHGEPRLSIVQKRRSDGIYVWRLPNGSVVSDGNGNIMNIPAKAGDIEAMSKITKAAAHYGYPEGRPEFQPGVRRITDEEYSVQKDRMRQGYIPSDTDLGAWYDAAKGIRKHGE